MKKMYRIVMALVVILQLVACSRQQLLDGCEEGAKVLVSIDWSQAALNPETDSQNHLYSASLWLFPKEGGKPLEYKLINARGGEITVPVGEYAAIVFNNTVVDYASIQFRGTDQYATFSVEAAAQSRNYYIAQGATAPFIQEPELLAAWSCEEVRITSEMVQADHQQPALAVRELTNIQPVRVVYTIKTLLHVRNVNAATMAAGVFAGMGNGCNLSTLQTTNNASLQAFTLNSRKYYPGSTTDGTVEATVRSFGAIPSADDSKWTNQTDGSGFGGLGASNLPANNYFKQSDFVLIDESEAGPFIFNITDHILYGDYVPRVLSLEIVLGAEGDPAIELPIFQGEGGMDVELDEWEEENVDIDF
ncbi:MAG: DUF5119 domain-containing protein [Phocaeicola sp.]